MYILVRGGSGPLFPTIYGVIVYFTPFLDGVYHVVSPARVLHYLSGHAFSGVTRISFSSRGFTHWTWTKHFMEKAAVTNPLC